LTFPPYDFGLEAKPASLLLIHSYHTFLLLGDFRIFCGDLGNEVTDDLLYRSFSKYSSIQKAKVVRDKRTTKSKGYGFVSFKDPNDFVKAMKEMNGGFPVNGFLKFEAFDIGFCIG
jgi:RNA recognition motif-containing protein